MNLWQKGDAGATQEGGSSTNAFKRDYYLLRPCVVS